MKSVVARGGDEVDNSELIVAEECIECGNCGGCMNDVCGNNVHVDFQLSEDGEGDICYCV